MVAGLVAVIGSGLPFLVPALGRFGCDQYTVIEFKRNDQEK
jgi:hypothetical protein